MIRRTVNYYFSRKTSSTDGSNTVAEYSFHAVNVYHLTSNHLELNQEEHL